MSRILVAGVPRSGTTWVGDVLGRSPGARVVVEPDNMHIDPLGLAAKRRRGEFPVLAPGEPGGLYGVMWTLAFRGGWPLSQPTIGMWRRTAIRFGLPAFYRLVEPAARLASLRPAYGGDVVVKTVYGVLALEWIAEHTGATVLVVRRNLLDVIASWLTLDVPAYPLVDAPRGGIVSGNEQVAARVCPALGTTMPQAGEPYVRRVAWTVGMLDAALGAALARNPHWHVVEHESLCADPEGGFRECFDRLGLRWTDGVAAYLAERNAPGTGYTTKRVAADVPGQWRRRLTPEQLAEVAAGLRSLPGEGAARALSAVAG